MKGMVITDFGGTEVFEQRELDRPEPGPNDVLVEIHATSINPVDTKIRQAGEWANVEPPAVIGYDVSGVVEAVGSEVTDFAVGDEVFYTPYIFEGAGSYAEYHVAPASIVAHKPRSLSHTEAAALPLAGATAWDAIVTNADVTAGETVLIHGTGGVGSHALQIAVASGARVITVSSPETTALAEELGADRAIDYEAESFLEVLESEYDEPVDVVFDTVGGETLAESTAITKPHGRLVTILNPEGDFEQAYLDSMDLHFLFLERGREKLEALARLVEQGRLEPVVDSVHPLEDVARAHELVEAGGLRGKVVLEVQ